MIKLIYLLPVLIPKLGPFSSLRVTETIQTTAIEDFYSWPKVGAMRDKVTSQFPNLPESSVNRVGTCGSGAWS